MAKKDTVALVHKDYGLIKPGLDKLGAEVHGYSSLGQLAEALFEGQESPELLECMASVKYVIAEVLHEDARDSQRVVTRALKGSFPNAGQLIVSDYPDRVVANIGSLGGFGERAKNIPPYIVGVVSNTGADLGPDMGHELFQNTLLAALGAENFKSARAAIPGVWQKYLAKQ